MIFCFLYLLALLVVLVLLLCWPVASPAHPPPYTTRRRFIFFFFSRLASVSISTIGEPRRQATNRTTSTSSTPPGLSLFAPTSTTHSTVYLSTQIGRVWLLEHCPNLVCRCASQRGRISLLAFAGSSNVSLAPIHPLQSLPSRPMHGPTFSPAAIARHHTCRSSFSFFAIANFLYFFLFFQPCFCASTCLPIMLPLVPSVSSSLAR